MKERLDETNNPYHAIKAIDGLPKYFTPLKLVGAGAPVKAKGGTAIKKKKGSISGYQS